LLLLVSIAPTSAAPSVTASQITSGKYLVNEVAKCGDCHTEHDEKREVVPASNSGEQFCLSR
jgi:hypothetical protein